MTRNSRTFRRLAEAEPPALAVRRLGRAVVLGGSVAGLLAARVLSDHADEVVVVEPDDLDEDATIRHGVPQTHQVHSLLPAGRAFLDRWLPGLSADLVAGGAGLATEHNSEVFYNGRRKVAVPGVELVMSTRPFLESVLRRHVLATPNVTVRRARATGLEVTGEAATAVRYAAEDGDGRLASDFVVDAMGRSSRLSRWLADLGGPTPTLERVRVDINYSTALFARSEPDPDIALSLVTWGIGRTPPDAAPAVINAVEGDRWIVMLGGYATDKPGRTVDAFRRVCSHLPDVFARAASGDLLEPIAGYTQADSRRRHFYALDAFPARLVAVGDAVASFNPIYGQGMSSAALHASCLSAYLCSGADLARPARAFFDLQRVVVDAAWQTSAVPDLALPHVTAPRPPGFRLSQGFGNLLIEATVTDLPLARRFADVMFMRTHPSTLLSPRTVARTLAVTAGRQGRRTRGSPA